MFDEPDTQDVRIEERRKRVLESIQESHADKTQTDEQAPAVQKGPGVQRVGEARHSFAQRLGEASNAVTLFEQAACTDESTRRVAEEERVEARSAYRTAEISDSKAKKGAIDLKFQYMYELNIPHDLQKALEEQKEQCDEVLDVKQKLIDELQNQLDDKQEAYVSFLKQNEVDIHGLVNTMHEQANTLMTEGVKQIEESEKTYEDERREFLQKCAAELDELVQTRRNRAAKYRKRCETQIVNAQVKTDEKHEENCEDYNSVKQEYEMGIQSLREELEMCKADFLLNGERLHYNLQVLRERVKESKATQNQYKRKLARLQDTLSHLVARYAESEKRYKKTNKELTTHLHGVAGKYTDLQKKFQTFERADKQKFQELWRLHEEKNLQLVHQNLQADRVLFEDLLGVQWEPLELNFWVEENEDEDVDEEEEQQEAQELELNEPAVMLLQILRLKAPFLVNENVEKAVRLVEGTTEEQAALEGILTTLNIQKTDDIEDLLEYFLVETEDEAKSFINPQEAVRALITYLNERRRRAEQETNAATITSRKGTTAVVISKEARRQAAERQFWSKMTEAVLASHQEVWKALNDALEKYLDQLQKRKRLLDQTTTLRSENEELRQLVMQYAGSDMNYTLHAPPQLTIGATTANRSV